MSQQPLRVGVIGGGGIAQMMHLPHLFERPDLYELVSLADVSEKTLAAVSKQYRIPHATTDFRALCARPEVDAVLLLSSGTHLAAGLAVLEAGKHLMVEKPLGYCVSEIEGLAAAAKKSAGKLMVGYHKRFDPTYRRAREAVKEMKDLRYVEVTVLHPTDDDYRAHHAILPDLDKPRAHPPEEVELRNAAAKATQGPLAPLIDEIVGKDAPVEHRIGAVILTESLIHDLNALRGILGEPEEVISSHLWKGGFAQSSVTRFGRDLRANISWVLVPELRNYEETLRFIGTDTRVTLTFPSPYLRNFPTPLSIERMEGGELVVEQHTVSYEEAFRAELRHFRDSVVHNKVPELTADDALGDARWIKSLATAYRRS